MDFTELARKRYSCKKYLPRQISEEQLLAILEAGRLAPTAKNLQGQHVYVLQSPEALAKVDAVTPCRYGAPTCLLVAYDRDRQFTYPDSTRQSGMEDASIVATHMMLCAASLGVDSCWVNFFNPEHAEREFGLPANEQILMFLDLGFADPEEGTPKPNHFSRRPLAETVTRL